MLKISFKIFKIIIIHNIFKIIIIFKDNNNWNLAKYFYLKTRIILKTKIRFLPKKYHKML